MSSSSIRAMLTMVGDAAPDPSGVAGRDGAASRPLSDHRDPSWLYAYPYGEILRIATVGDRPVRRPQRRRTRRPGGRARPRARRRRTGPEEPSDGPADRRHHRMATEESTGTSAPCRENRPRTASRADTRACAPGFPTAPVARGTGKGRVTSNASAPGFAGATTTARKVGRQTASRWTRIWIPPTRGGKSIVTMRTWSAVAPWKPAAQSPRPSSDRSHSDRSRDEDRVPELETEERPELAVRVSPPFPMRTEKVGDVRGIEISVTTETVGRRTVPARGRQAALGATDRSAHGRDACGGAPRPMAVVAPRRA